MKNNCFIIKGGKKLYGKIKNQTSKNATLPIMSACLLADGKTVLREYPKISDVENMISILKKIGAKINKLDDELVIETSNIKQSNRNSLRNSAVIDYSCGEGESL